MTFRSGVSVGRCSSVEIAFPGGRWERVGARSYQVGAWTRPASHLWEHIPPSYRRCRSCGKVEAE